MDPAPCRGQFLRRPFFIEYGGNPPIFLRVRRLSEYVATARCEVDLYLVRRATNLANRSMLRWKKEGELSAQLPICPSVVGRHDIVMRARSQL
jgi:hypothetical protein